MVPENTKNKEKLREELCIVAHPLPDLDGFRVLTVISGGNGTVGNQKRSPSVDFLFQVVRTGCRR